MKEIVSKETNHVIPEVGKRIQQQQKKPLKIMKGKMI
jgi:hypothetical protein